MGGTESQGTSRVRQTLLARLMESQIWHSPALSVVLLEEVQQRDNGLCLPFCLGERRKLSPSSCHNARHFSSFLYATDAIQLLPWCWSSERVSQSKSVHEFPKRNCMGLQKFLPLIQSPLVFAARRYGDLSSWYWNPGLGGLVWSWDSSLPTYTS